MLDATATGHGPDLAPFDWKEPFRLSNQLTDEERMITEAARAYLAPQTISKPRDPISY